MKYVVISISSENTEIKWFATKEEAEHFCDKESRKNIYCVIAEAIKDYNPVPVENNRLIIRVRNL